jgi:Lrp/AsnC family leucine-responsive transcriptional regulator
VLAFVRAGRGSQHRGRGPAKLEDAIRKIPEIVSCHYISGAGTFELQVVSQRPGQLLGSSRGKVLINLPNVKDLHTSFSLGEVKSSSAVPLGHLAK